MAENERNQQQQPGGSNQHTQTGNQGGQSQNRSGQGGQGSEDQNPQGGGHWNNYRTRELSDEGTGEGKASTPERE